MSKARDLADSIAEGSVLADGVVSLSEISGGTNNGVLYTTSEGVTHSGSNLTFDGDHLHVSGNINATTFIGDGSELTGIDALPSQTDNDNKYLKTNGTVATWEELVIPEVPVDSVNGYIGTVVLTASDVGAATASDISTAVTGLASETYVGTAVANLVDSSPATLDTLNELAAALGDDPNFATTVSTNIGTKADKTTLISAGTGLTGGGDLSTNRTITHANSTVTAATYGSSTSIPSITVDERGHVTAASGNAISVGDGAFTVNTGSGLTGGAQLGTANQSGNTSITVSHADTSTQSSVDNSNGTVIQDVSVDGFGHVTGLASVDLDSRYYTETEADDRFVKVTGDTMTGTLTVSGSTWSNATGGNLIVSNSNTVGSSVTLKPTASTSYSAGWSLYAGAGSANIGDGSVGLWNHTAQSHRFWVDYTGNSYSVTSSRAPIFYDSDNTGYYVDPASSTSAIFAGSVGLGINNPINSAWGSATDTRQMTIYGSNYGVLNLKGDYNTDAHYSMGVGDNRFYAAYDNVGGKHRLTFLGDFTGFNGITDPLYNIHLAGTGFASNDWRAPIFYDSQNTGYYSDPSGNSNINELTTNGLTRFTGGNSLYVSAVNPNTLNSGYGAASNDSDIWLNYRGYNDAQDYYRNFNVGDGRGANILWASGANKRLSINNSQTANYTLDVNGTGYSSSDFRAPIFYDSNDTSYYVNPNSASLISSLNINGDFRTTFASGGGGHSFSSNHYSMGKDIANGTWSNPHYSDLIIGYHTGIRIGAAYTGIRFYNNSPTTDANNDGNGDSGEALLMTVGGHAGGNVSVIVNNTLTALGDVRSPISYDSNDTAFYVDPNSGSTSAVFAGNISLNGILARRSAGTGYLSGNYASSESTTTTGAIYTIGGPYYPTSTGLNNMYGIGYTYASVVGGAGAYTSGSSWGLYVATNGNAQIFLDSDNGRVLATGDMRAPIYYDSANTTYYADPNSMSSMYGIAIRGDVASTDTANQIFFWGPGNSTTSAIGFKANGGSFSNPTGNGDGYNTYLTMDSPGRGWIFREGVGGTNFGASYTSGWILNNGIWQANASMRAPIFYDSNDTARYLDPNGGSVLYYMNLTRASSGSDSNGLPVIKISGLSGYDSLEIGIQDNYQAQLRTYGNDIHYYSGHWKTAGTAATENHRHYWYTSKTGSSNWSSWKMQLDPDANLYANGSVRSPIFYDSENTGQYVDPNSFSQLSSGNFNAAPSGRTLSLGGDQLDRVYNDSARSSLVINGTYYPHLYINATANNGNVNHGAVFSMTGNLTGGGYRRWGMGIANTDPDCFSWGYYDNNANPHYGVGGAFGYTATNSKMWLSTGGSLWTTGDMRTPIFYDSNDTSYYLDPNSTSRLNNVNANGGNWYEPTYFHANRNTTSDNPALQAYSNNASGAIMSFHRGGYYAVNMGLDSDNVFRIGGWSAAANRLQMDMSGNLTMAGNITANSDERLKKDWLPVDTDFVEKLSKVKSGTYTRIDSNERQAGSSAQDWQSLLPEVVTESNDGTLSLAYGNAALLSAVELAKIVVDQEARIKRLEALVEKLI